jgi:hypothetical protein
MMAETEREMIVRQIGERETRIARQDIRIERLRRNGQTLETAISLQTTMQNALERLRIRLEQLSN